MKRKSIPPKPVRKIRARIPFISFSNADEQHMTTLYDDGTAHCTCDGFKHREDCRHVKALRKDYVAVEIRGDFYIAHDGILIS